MKIWRLTEDKLSPKLPVILTPEINSNIGIVEENNTDSEDAICQWKESLSAIISQISNPSIAWDNMEIYMHNNNGETYAKIFGHDIAYHTYLLPTGI